LPLARCLKVATFPLHDRRPRLAGMIAAKELPFDGKRMIYGGFETLVKLRAL
jgi:uncharacterized protein YbaA (DUF1428 family)